MYLYVVLFAFILIGILMVLFFLVNDRGEKEPINALIIAILFGLVTFPAAGIIETLFINSTYLNPQQSSYKQAFLAFMLVGFIEESLKIIPLAAYIYKQKFFNEHTDGIIYFALAGLGFGIPENIIYTFQYGARAGVGRLMLTPIFHAATVAIVGYYLIQVKLNKRSWWSVVIALIGAILIHGVYDFSLSTDNPIMISIAVAITMSISSLLFINFLSAKKIDQLEGLARPDKNSPKIALQTKPNAN